MSGRKRADSNSSASTDSSPKKKGRGERLVSRGRDHATVGTSFVSGSHEISVALVETVSCKACQFYLTFRNTDLGHEHYYGQGGLIQGERLTVPPPDNDEQKKKRHRSSRKVSFFSEYASFEATPVTAKHNLESCDNEQYLRTTVKFADGYETDITMPDGGCLLDGEAEIEVRAATQNSAASTWDYHDVSFGTKLDNKSALLTRKPRLFEKVPSSFELRVGHKIGIAVYRTFDITYADAKAPSNVALEDFYGQKLQACIYTGKVTEISASRKTFCHNINAFEGCSGAVVFLLDRNQEVGLEAFHGMAVGVHVGGLDSTNNIAFFF